MDEHAHDGTDPGPESPTSHASRILIRRTGMVWSLEDETQLVGGVFATLEAALAFARAEQLHGAGAIRIIVEERPRPARRLQAA
jgi:hypothetical protein